jgi:predicted nucleotidyltransferase
MYGLRHADIDWMQALFKKYPSIEQVLIFGSRSVGRYRTGSDVDLALLGNGITPATAREIKMLLEEESPMPFFFDVVRYDGIADLVFKSKIDLEGKSIYNSREGLV